MASDLDKARLMLVLARSKGNWGAKYDRTEHFKRFQNLKEIIKELSSKGWLLIHNKHNYTGLSLNSHYKKEIIEYIELHLPEVRGMVK